MNARSIIINSNKLKIIIIFVMKKGAKTYENVEDVEMVLKTTKQSQTGIFSNQRLLVMKAGVVSYFSQVPKKFSGSARAIQFAGQLPKYTILASDIDHMQLKTNSLTILFKKQKLITKSQFNKFVTQKQIIPDRSQVSSKSDSNYMKWIFQCNDEQMMRQFYAMINLFRTSNPKFKPCLGSYISSFQAKKNNGGNRQMSMNSSLTSQAFKPNMQGRMSQKPTINNDLILQHILKQSQPKIKEPQIIKPQIKPQQPQKQIKQQQQTIKNQPLDENLQKNRLHQVKQKIETRNYPQLGIIDQKQNQDKLSQLSKNVVLFQKKPDSSIDKSHDQIEVLELNGDNEDGSLGNSLRQSIQISKQDENPREINPLVQEKQKLIQKLHQSIQQQDEQDESDSQQNTSQQQQQFSQQTHPSIKQSSNQSGYFQSHQQLYTKKKKLKQFINAYHYISDGNESQLCSSLKITKKQYQDLILQYLNQDIQYWSSIQSSLTKVLSAENKNIEIMKIRQQIIQKYHKINKNNMGDDDFQDNYSHDKKLLSHNQISFDTYQHGNQQQKQALQYISFKISQEVGNKTTFQTKIFNQSLFKIYTKSIQFKKEDIIYIQNGWIINKGSYLQQFLACLRLEKIIGHLAKNNFNKINLKCSEIYYLRYKDIEGIAKMNRVNNTFLPLKSIKHLQFLAKSKQLISFQTDFPQFTIIVQTLKNNKQFKFHLDRTSQHYNIDPLIHQLKKITFTYNNEIDIFCQTQTYNTFVNQCLDELEQIREKRLGFNGQVLQKILQKINYNIKLNILFKLLNCRMDNRGNIYFHHCVLKLGGRQFGQELQFINRTKRKGNLDLSRHLSKKIISKLQYYKHVTPISHFIQIYLQIIDTMIVQEGQLHKAVPILLKISSNLAQYQLQQYSIYLYLMKIYLQLNQISNFIKILQNCRLFIHKTFKQYSLVLDYQFQRLISIFLLKQDINKALIYNEIIIKTIQNDTSLPDKEKIKYKCKSIWDRCNMLISVDKAQQAYRQCQQTLKMLEESELLYQDIWNEGVVCLGKCLLVLEQINSINASNVQKRIAQALELSFYRQNLQMTFIIYEVGQKILQKCIQNKLPKILQFSLPFQRAKIQYKQSHAYLKQLIIQMK